MGLSILTMPNCRVMTLPLSAVIFSPDWIANATGELISASLRATTRALAVHPPYWQPSNGHAPSSVNGKRGCPSNWLCGHDDPGEEKRNGMSDKTAKKRAGSIFPPRI